jgi:NAD-dependent dihydropyrimidine dehydrogenase PreA subunit
MASRVTVVVSQTSSHNPGKRSLEEDIVTALLATGCVDVVVIPHLYDLRTESTGVLALQGVSGDLVLLAWMYDRPARWVLDQHAVRGRIGETRLLREDQQPDAGPDSQTQQLRFSLEREEIPNRHIYCLDLRTAKRPETFVDEVHRIVQECRLRHVATDGTQQPVSPSHVATIASSEDGGNGSTAGHSSASQADTEGRQATRLDETVARRWYPVIDFDRCTNCMECIDFCLFGVFGIDEAETILVEQPDNCRKGCPACSRVCPANAIMFPQHSSPAIAGGPAGAEDYKIDLSSIFGQSGGESSAREVAHAERQRFIKQTPRETASSPRAEGEADTSSLPKDELDRLIDSLDELDL